MDDYKKIIQSDKPVLVEFYATWCGPCKKLMPRVKEIAAENKNKLNVSFVDVDNNNLVSDALRIRNIPVVIYYVNGKEQWRLTGLQSKKAILKKMNL